ncbi:MAG: carbohydrate kinase family protein [Candidatus Magasanikbacteria bacterium]
MSILISGSLAYDYIMDFPDSFKNHILPDQIHILNVCFVVDQLNKNYGGVAGNIGYTMKLLGGNPIIFAPLGKDGEDYITYLKKVGINTDHIPVSKERLTSSAHITTDKDDNQITAFYNGALSEASNLSIGSVKEDIKFTLISPTDKNAMIKHAKECYDLKIPFCFDPGQQITAFSPQELMAVIGQAKFLIGNDYEMKLIQEKTGWDMSEMLNHVEVLITTLGDRGSVITTKDQIFEVGICQPLSVDDPTGAGDAYRAGFFTAYLQGCDYQTCGQMGAVASTYAIENYGTQEHKFSIDEFKKRYEDAFGEVINLEL